MLVKNNKQTQKTNLMVTENRIVVTNGWSMRGRGGLKKLNSKVVIPRGWGGGGAGHGKLLFNENRISVLQDEKFWRLMVVMVAQ